MTTYRISVKYDDDTLRDTKYYGMTKDHANETMEALYMDIPPLENWAGLAVTDDNGDIYAEMEW